MQRFTKKCLKPLLIQPFYSPFNYSKVTFQHSLMLSKQLFSSTKKPNTDQQDESNGPAGFNIFEQLKQQQKSNESFEEPELSPREKERLKRNQESAEKEINERQSRTFGLGTAFLVLGLVGSYAFMGELVSYLVNIIV